MKTIQLGRLGRPAPWGLDGCAARSGDGKVSEKSPVRLSPGRLLVLGLEQITIHPPGRGDESPGTCPHFLD